MRQVGSALAVLLCMWPLGCSDDAMPDLGAMDSPTSSSAGADAVATDLGTVAEPSEADTLDAAAIEAPEEVGTDADAVDAGEGLVEEPTEPLPFGWRSVPLGATGTLHRARFVSLQDGFVLVGEAGQILRPLGQGWVRAYAPMTEDGLWDVVAVNGVLHAVGDDGRWQTQGLDGAWSALDLSIDADLRGLTRLGDAALACGLAGVVIRLGSDQKVVWEVKDPGWDLLALATFAGEESNSEESNTEAFAVGTDGRIMRRAPKDDGNVNWFADNSAGVEHTLRGIWALDADNIWA
ncbi:MAG: hypothetical protein ACI9WU_003288, partial [Myxococcota bacterium]